MIFCRIGRSNTMATLATLLLFYLALYFISLILFRDVYLPAYGREGEFVLQNFLIYNFSLKVVFYLFKFLTITLLIFLGAFIVDDNIKPGFLTTFRLTIMAEFVKLVPDLLAVNWFAVFPGKLTSGSYEAFYTWLSPLAGMLAGQGSVLYYLLQSMAPVEILYMAFLTYLYKQAHNLSWAKAFMISGFMYFAGSLLWNLTKALLFI